MKKKIRINYTLITAILLFSAAVFISCIFYSLYIEAKNNIIRSWKNSTTQAARDVDYYMTMPENAVSISAATIESLASEGASHKTIGQYLIDQTEIYASLINDNTTGVYAYYDGKYLDGSGWIPPRYYVPQMRPWYEGAIKQKGSIALVKPYLNLQTNTYMMSVSKMLSDGESVVSMDVFLDGVQSLATEVASEQEIEAALVIDIEGNVVACSDEDDVGKNYLKDGDEFEQKLAGKLKSATNGQFEMEGNGTSYIIFCDSIGDNWNMVFILNKDKTLASLGMIFLALMIALVVVVLVIMTVFFHVTSKHRESRQLGHEMMAMADFYIIAVRVDLPTGNMEIIRGNDDLDRILDNDLTRFNERTQEFARRMTSERSRELMKKFMDPSTLIDRLSEVDSITQEYMDIRGRWIRLRFITAERDANGQAVEILWTFESIDEDRKQQEALRKLSETDIMTGVKNRGSGESYIRQEIAEGKQGMFLLMDADDFKSVNDTFGHKVGDKVIIAIADSLTNAFRDTDIVFRLGGDEFAVFAEGITDKETGLKVIDRFFDELTNAPLPELKGRIITASVGAAFYTDTRYDTFENLYERADRGTYESKRHGGNHVTFEDDELHFQ